MGSPLAKAASASGEAVVGMAGGAGGGVVPVGGAVDVGVLRPSSSLRRSSTAGRSALSSGGGSVGSSSGPLRK